MPPFLQRHKTLLLSVVATLTLMSCNTVHDPITIPHYAAGYIPVGTYALKAYIHPNRDAILLVGNKSSHLFAPLALSNDVGLSRAYERCAQAYGDLCTPPQTYEYNDLKAGEYFHFFKGAGGYNIPYRVFLSSPIVAVGVKSNIAWGDTYPAGSNLSAEFWLMTRSLDRVALSCQPSQPQVMPDGLPTFPPYFQQHVKPSDWGYKGDTYGELIVARASEMDFSKARYAHCGPFNWFMPLMLTSLHSMFAHKQELTISITFSNGETFEYPVLSTSLPSWKWEPLA